MHIANLLKSDLITEAVGPESPTEPQTWQRFRVTRSFFAKGFMFTMPLLVFGLSFLGPSGGVEKSGQKIHPVCTAVRWDKSLSFSGKDIYLPYFHLSVPSMPLNKNRHARTVRKLAGPFARDVLQAARRNHLSARLIAAVIQVETGGNFRGAASRVSSVGAIGVMQLEPATADAVLHVNPWSARQNIQGGARFLAMLLREFGNLRLALMAYNAGPTWIAHGGRPQQAANYARRVMRDAHVRTV